MSVSKLRLSLSGTLYSMGEAAMFILVICFGDSSNYDSLWGVSTKDIFQGEDKIDYSVSNELSYGTRKVDNF